MEDQLIDFETGIPLRELGLLREEERGNGKVMIYRPPSAFTPPILVIRTCVEIKKHYPSFTVLVENYYNADEINDAINGIKHE